MKRYYVKLLFGSSLVLVSAWLFIGYRMSNNAPSALAVSNPTQESSLKAPKPGPTVITKTEYTAQQNSGLKSASKESTAVALSEESANKLKTASQTNSQPVTNTSKPPADYGREAAGKSGTGAPKPTAAAPSAVVNHYTIKEKPTAVATKPTSYTPPSQKATKTYVEEPCDEPTPAPTIAVTPTKKPAAPSATPVVVTKVVKSKHTVVLAQTTQPTPTPTATPQASTIPPPTDLPSTGPEAGLAISLVGAAAGLVWRKSHQLS